MFHWTKFVMMASLGASLWPGLVRAQHLEVKGNASVATGDKAAGLAVGLPPADRQAKVHIKATGYFLGENADGTSQGADIPLLLQPENSSTAFGFLNPHGRQAFALNLEADDGTTTGRGMPVFYDKFDGIWHPSFYLRNGSVGIGRTPEYSLDVSGDIRANGWIRTNGSAGWYSQTYGGGWWMYDEFWMRTYNEKSIWTGAGYLGSNGGLTIGYGGAPPPWAGAAFAGSVGIGTREPAHQLDVYGDIGVRGVDAIRLDGTNAHLFPWSTGYADRTVHVGAGAVTNLQVHGTVTATAITVEEGVKVYKIVNSRCEGVGGLTVEQTCLACSIGDRLCAGKKYPVDNAYLGKLVN